MTKPSKVSVAYRLPEAPARFDLPNLSTEGPIESREVIRRDRFRLAAWQHELQQGARIRIDHPAEDHLFYVLSGEISIGGETVGPEGAISVARNAEAEIGGEGVVLHWVGDAATRPDKPGGCVHVVRRGWMERTAVSHHTLYLDSDCPTCSVWLHRTHTSAGKVTSAHHHSEDEIICVVEGSMKVGPREIVTGGAIGVANDVVYSFTAGEEGLTFVNFRQADPYYMPQGTDQTEPASERKLYYALLERLKAQRLAAA